MFTRTGTFSPVKDTYNYFSIVTQKMYGVIQTYSMDNFYHVYLIV